MRLGMTRGVVTPKIPGGRSLEIGRPVVMRLTGTDDEGGIIQADDNACDEEEAEIVVDK